MELPRPQQREVAVVTGGSLNRLVGRFSLATFTVCVAGSIAFGAGQASASHVSCGDEITADTTLDSDLVDCPNNGIVIGADDITIFLNGHTIDGDEALTKTCGKEENCDVGIVNEGFDGVIVNEGTLREFAIGTVAFGTKHASLRALRVRDNMFLGMVVEGADQTRLQWSRISGNGLDTDQAGVGIFESRRTQVSGNVISRNGDIGIFTPDSKRTDVHGNRINGNPKAGVLGGGNETLVGRNKFVRNGVAIQLEAGRRNVIAGNRIRLAGKDGIKVVSAFDAVTRVNLRANRVAGSGDDGIDVNVRSAKISRNTVRRNGDLGIEAVAGVIDGGGNKANRNGNPAQCTNVACN